MNPFLLSLLVCVLLTGCADGRAAGTAGTAPGAGTPSHAQPAPSPLAPLAPLAQVQTWGVQLTGYGSARLKAVTASALDLIVVDPTDDEGHPWTPAEVQQARGKRLLLAYLSMGAAEDYRPYWQAHWKVGAPAWLLRQDPDWPGNYDVAYWDPAWKTIALAQLDRVIAQGFDGVYMDLIDAYERNEDRPTARAEMVAWVCQIAAHARQKKPGFLIVPQNAAELLRDPGYAGCVDASGNESTFMYPGDQRTEPERQRALLSDFALWKNLGKPVFTIEYVADPALQARTLSAARAHGLIPFIGVRTLNRTP